MKKALVVLSGGQDSTTCLAFMQANYKNTELHAITFDYGQRHSRELEAAQMVAQLAGIGDRHEIVPIPDILKGTSPLTDKSAQLEQYDNHDQMEAIIGNRIEKTFVPMRNALFLTIAANRAAVLGADFLVTGVCQADNANYPDCRVDFINAQEKAINEALGDFAAVHIITPLMFTDKAQSVRQMAAFGVEVFAWLAFSHTAYDGQYPPVGKDHATVLRAHGFEQAGYPDPLVLRAAMEGKMELPTTSNYRATAIHGVPWHNSLVSAINAHKRTLGVA